MALYNGGGMTTYPKQLMMKEVKQFLEDNGIEVYDPSSQPFNDKKAVGGDDIARQIVAKDTEAIYNSDIRLMNTQEDNLGTAIEAGIIKGFRDYAMVMLLFMEKYHDKLTPEEQLKVIYEFSSHEVIKEYVPYHTDIRIHNEPETGFRRSVGFHQFLRGLNLTMGEYFIDDGYDFDGFFSLTDALEYVRSIQEDGYPAKNYKAPLHISVDTDGEINVHMKGMDK